MAATFRENMQALYALQQIDKQIQRAKKSQSSLDNGTQAKANAEAIRNQYQEKLNILHKLSGDLKDSELKLSGVETKRKSYQQKLYQGTVTNPKELQNIEKEIQALGHQQSDLDGKILDLMDQVEQQKQIVTEAEANACEAETKHKAIVSNFESKYESLGLETTDLTRQRADAVQGIEDKALLKKYEDIRAKSAGLAIVKIEGSDCGGCHMTLPSTLIKAVKEGQELTLCENCQRILTA
jgi:uncharacterized protein